MNPQQKVFQEGTRAWRVKAFGALCVFAITPLAILTTVTLVKVSSTSYSDTVLINLLKEKSLEESEAQLAGEMASMVGKIEKLGKRSAHCGFQ